MLTPILTLAFGLIALAVLTSLADSGIRARNRLLGVERLPMHTPYTGPLYNRHGRELVTPEVRYV